MPWYSVAKLYLLKAWAWCKKYWQFLVGFAIPIILGIAFRRRGLDKPAQEVIANIQEGHQQEVTAIDESHRIEGEKIQAAQQRREETVAAVEEQASAERVELDEKKKREIRRIVRKYENDPDELTRQLSRATGISVWTGNRNR